MSSRAGTYLDGSVLIGAMDGVIRDRIRMALNGHVIVTVIVDEDTRRWATPGATPWAWPRTAARTRRCWTCSRPT